MASKRWVLGTVGLVVIGGAGWLLSGKHARGERAAAASASAAAADRPTVVAVATAAKQDVAIYLDGLGTVTPLQTVTVKSQVDGPLEKVLFKEGDFVKKGDVLAQIDPRPFIIAVHQAQSALAKDQATLANAQATLKRNVALQDNGLASQQTVDDQRALVASSEAGLLGDRTAIESAQLKVEYARITSPIDGVTGVRQADPGNVIVANTTPLVVITQLDPMGIIFTLPQDDLPRVAAEQAKGQVAVEATSRDGSQKLGTGTLMLVDNQINASTGTIRLKASMPNPGKTLWPNGFVKARIFLATKKDAIVVPATAVQRGPQGLFAYVVGPDNTASVRPIEPDVYQGDTVLVAKGLTAGERVVVDGQTQLKPGGKVSIRNEGKPPVATGSAR